MTPDTNLINLLEFYHGRSIRFGLRELIDVTKIKKIKVRFKNDIPKYWF